MPTMLRTRNFRIERFKFRRDGRTIEFYRIVMGNTATALPVLDDGRIVMERQYRPSVGKYLYELPSGHGDKGESPGKCAARELEEETGYIAGSVKPMFTAYIAPGASTELMHFFLATKLRKSRPAKGKDEFIEQEQVGLEEALGMIRSGRIKDAKTIACLLYYSAFVRK